MRAAFFLFHVLRRSDPHGQLQPDAVGVEKIDRVDEVVVSHAQHLDAGGFQPRLGGLQVGGRIHLERDVVDPGRGVGRRGGRGVVAQVEKRDVFVTSKRKKWFTLLAADKGDPENEEKEAKGRVVQNKEEAGGSEG